jgi:glycosyltransferase involved in cell wall biosynthesis
MMLSNIIPEYSIILAVYNQEGIVGRNLELLMNNTSGPWELIIVLDGCQDRSIDEVLLSIEDWFRRVNSSGTYTDHCSQSLCELGCMVGVRVIEQRDPADEVASNNVGMRAADPRSSYFVLVQPDMKIFEPGWNVALSIPSRAWPDVFSVSARCAHDFSGSRFVGLCSSDVDQGFGPMGLDTRHVFAVRQTGNRGPLLLHAKRVAQLGYLDEVGHYRGDDDHDLNARAWNMGRWVSGFYPVQFRAPLIDGATRRSKPEGPAREREDSAQIARNELVVAFPSFLSRIRNSGTLGAFGSADEDRLIPMAVLDEFLCQYFIRRA